jgi:hypothetical protein
MRLCEKNRFGNLQGIVFMENFWNFTAIPNTENHFDVGLKQTCSKNNSSDSHGHVFTSIEKICFAFGENMKRHFIGQRGSRFNLRVSKNRSSMHSFYLYE